jgi:hypothetical protein
MTRLALIIAFTSAAIYAQQADESFEVEPDILPQNLTTDSASDKPAAPAPVLDLAKLEKDLERAKKNAAGAERLYKMGALAKVEAEARALKVVRLESEIENARLAQAKEEALSQTEQKDAAETSKSEETKTGTDLAHAIEAAHAAAAKRERAEMEAAQINLFRQQKLLALGSGNRASVRRAEQKLIELQTLKE